jgi:hypothetical protein
MSGKKHIQQHYVRYYSTIKALLNLKVHQTKGKCFNVCVSNEHNLIGMPIINTRPRIIIHIQTTYILGPLKKSKIAYARTY